MERRVNRNRVHRDDITSLVSPRPAFGFRLGVGLLDRGHHVALPMNNFGNNDIFVPIRFGFDSCCGNFGCSNCF